MENVNYYTLEEVVAITGASEGTVCGWRRDKKIESFKSPNNGRILVFDSNSFFKFITNKANKKYFDCACAKSNLFHNNDFNTVISLVQSIGLEEARPVVKKEQPKAISPISTKADMKAFETHITDIDKAIARVDNSIKHLTHVKTSYISQKVALKDKDEENNKHSINKLNACIIGVHNSIEVLESIKRGYKANKRALISVIETDKNLDIR